MTNEKIKQDILECFQRLFRVTIRETEAINRGWLNLKWKVTTDSGQFLIKQYNKGRFKLYSNEELLIAFVQQNRLNAEGIACPRLMPYGEEFLLESDNGERYLVMEFCEGDVVPPGQLTSNQMYQLGKTTGKMHQLLNDGRLEAKAYPEFKPPSPKERLMYWRNTLDEVNDEGKTHLLSIVESQLRTTEYITFNDFNLHEWGWAHRDLWVDNLLFNGNNLQAIIDFDRMKFDYPQLDVARAVISGALDQGALNLSAAHAFIEGYREEKQVTQDYLTRHCAYCGTWRVHGGSILKWIRRAVRHFDFQKKWLG